MAFTYVAPVRVNNIAVGDQVVFAVAADGHGYVYPTPTTTGATYPTVRALVPATPPPGVDNTGAALDTGDVLWTVYLTPTSPFNAPVDFVLNANSDWVGRATGTA